MNSCCFRPLPHPLLSALLLCCLLLVTAETLTANELFDGDLGTPAPVPTQQLLSSTSAAPADDKLPESRVRTPEEPSDITPNLSPADAARLAREHTGGQVMSVNTSRSAGRIIYGVKVLNAGRMRVVNIDGVSGDILNP